MIRILKIFICVISFFNSLESQSQNFVNTGAEWNFKTIVSGAPYTAFTNWKYQNDTLIQGMTYQIIKKRTKNYNYFSSSIYEYSSGSFLLRSSGDSLFYSKSDSLNEHLLYDFTPSIGNTWDVSPFLEGLTSSPTTPQLVQTIAFGDTLINGNTVNWIDIISLNPDSLYFGSRIYNHMGSRNFFPFWDDGSIDTQISLWKCYRDDILDVISFSSCDDYETLGTENIKYFDLNLISDSKNKRLIIDKIEPLDINSLVVYDLMGRQVIYMDHIDSNQIDISLPSGIYICNLSVGNIKFSQKFLW